MHWRECEKRLFSRISAIFATSTVCAVHGAEQAVYWNTDSPDAEKSKSQAAISFSQQRITKILKIMQQIYANVIAIIFTENVYCNPVVVGKCLLYLLKFMESWKFVENFKVSGMFIWCIFLAILKLAEITVLSPAILLLVSDFETVSRHLLSWILLLLGCSCGPGVFVLCHTASEPVEKKKKKSPSTPV